MKRLTFIILMAVSFAACNQSSSTESTVSANATSAASIDSLNNRLYDLWNKKDSAAIVSLFTDDVIMISGRGILKGRDDVARNFVGRQLRYASNLKGAKERSEASDDLGFIAGVWSLTSSAPNKPSIESTGNYNFITKKGDDGIWRFSVLTIENHDPIE